jgi:hypothetical protein
MKIYFIHRDESVARHVGGGVPDFVQDPLQQTFFVRAGLLQRRRFVTTDPRACAT